MSNNSNQRLEELRQKRNEAKLGGGLKKQEAIRKSGRGTARDRIGMLPVSYTHLTLPTILLV